VPSAGSADEQPRRRRRGRAGRRPPETVATAGPRRLRGRGGIDV